VLPWDPRIRQESRAAQRLGLRVFGISPTTSVAGGSHPAVETVDGMKVLRYPLVAASGGILAYGREFGGALWHTARLLRHLARETEIDIVHAGNPPDFLLLAALALKRQGTRIVFDHHDVSPELYLSRSGRQDPVYLLLRSLERLAFRQADVVVSANESFRRLAIERGGKDPDDVVVVRNGPDLAQFRLKEPDAALKRGKPYLLAYAGVMGRQDGIDYAIRALAALHQRRQDWRAVLMGDGETLPEARDLATRLGLGDVVDFPGWTAHDDLLSVLSTADVCLAPDPKTAANDISTLIKIMEYMALARPVVSFDLAESRFSAGPAGAFVPSDDVEEFARAIDRLLDDPGRRAAMGAAGRERVERELSWQHSEAALGRVYERLLAA
jgi:glycosyltransferase involved in cell wall biosynthesis